MDKGFPTQGGKDGLLHGANPLVERHHILPFLRSLSFHIQEVFVAVIRAPDTTALHGHGDALLFNQPLAVLSVHPEFDERPA